jgi:DNA-binding MarR family transcriptional regulator
MAVAVASRTRQGEEATEVILSTFRLNGLLIAAGDELAAEYGLTSARWQVLGAIALAKAPLTVPHVARRMGLARQTVHTTVNHLLADGLVELVPNADHRRSQFVRLTKRGDAAYRAIDEKYSVWINQLAGGLRVSDLTVVAQALRELCRRLEADAQQSQEPERR